MAYASTGNHKIHVNSLQIVGDEKLFPKVCIKDSLSTEKPQKFKFKNARLFEINLGRAGFRE